MERQIRIPTRFVLVVTILVVWTSVAIADQQERTVSFEVPRSDLAQAQALANQLVALSPRVDREEATRLAQCAYSTVSQLRKQYPMFGTPIFNNFLIYHGIKKRGYCFQWAEDLLVALDALKLTSLELHWGESNPGNWRENNCLVVTARGQPFKYGIILDCWRHFGRLRWNAVGSDEDPYVENSAYARFVRSRSAAAADRHLAFQKKLGAKEKNGE